MKKRPLPKRNGPGFVLASQLQQHTALHHQPGKPYECGKCHYSFVHKLKLKRHELTHLEEERVSAEDDPSIQLLEDESFNAEELAEPDELSPVVVGLMPREDQLIEHLKTHIERMKVIKQGTQSAKKILTDDSDKKCKLSGVQVLLPAEAAHSDAPRQGEAVRVQDCFYRYEYSAHLVRHIRTNHDNQQEDAIGDAIERNFVCTFCSELFEQKSQLNSHIKTYHRGEKQFKCDLCPASFAYKKTFENHREEHHSIKPGGKNFTSSTDTNLQLQK
ncbi:hypothetical protein pipiens_015107 [Culex pipiens pipiens]|uniref:C2H2-type domain-containing protein n=1 Tax=Culex pipiens pipiens TaxID=38569 RepID=A0ABD1CRZ9_CULPP